MITFLVSWAVADRLDEPRYYQRMARHPASFPSRFFLLQAVTATPGTYAGWTECGPEKLHSSYPA